MGELHKVIQEAQSNDDSVTDELLILAMQKFEEDQAGWYLGNGNQKGETNKNLLLVLQKKTIQVMDGCYNMKV